MIVAICHEIMGEACLGKEECRDITTRILRGTTEEGRALAFMSASECFIEDKAKARKEYRKLEKPIKARAIAKLKAQVLSGECPERWHPCMPYFRKMEITILATEQEAYGFVRERVAPIKPSKGR